MVVEPPEIDGDAEDERRAGEISPPKDGRIARPDRSPADYRSAVHRGEALASRSKQRNQSGRQNPPATSMPEVYAHHELLSALWRQSRHAATARSLGGQSMARRSVRVRSECRNVRFSTKWPATREGTGEADVLSPSAAPPPQVVDPG